MLQGGGSDGTGAFFSVSSTCFSGLDQSLWEMFLVVSLSAVSSKTANASILPADGLFHPAVLSLVTVISWAV
jgi:hypothetical protein